MQRKGWRTVLYTAVTGRPEENMTDNKQQKKEFIRIRGARENNLKNLDVDIPRNKLVVLTGLSGCVPQRHCPP